MDGLECKELLFSTVKQANKSIRFDPEYYSKLALSTESFILSRSHYFLDTKNVVSGPFGSTLKSSSYLEKGDIPFVRIENIKGGFYISRSNLVYISSFDNSRIANSQLSEDDIVLSKVGNSIGFFARVDSVLKECNISENNIGIKLEGYSTAQKHAMLTYFNSKYGQILLLRRRSGNAQPKLNVDDVCYIPIPVFSNEFCEKISIIIIQSEMLKHQSQDIYEKASSYLLSKLKYDASAISINAIVSKDLSNSFMVSGRLDAEYYQTKYEDITRLLNAVNTVDSLCNIYDKSFTPFNNTYYQYIELADVGLNGVIDGVETICGFDLPTRARRIVKTGQVIISSIEGSLQSCALIPEEYNNALCSTGFYVIDSDVMNSETLLLLFKSEPIQLLMKQRCSGTILTGISKNEFLSMPLPLIDDDIQKYIATEVQKSFAKRKQSQHLIDTAVHAVEVAIETGEDAAFEWLEKQVD